MPVLKFLPVLFSYSYYNANRRVTYDFSIDRMEYLIKNENISYSTSKNFEDIINELIQNMNLEDLKDKCEKMKNLVQMYVDGKCSKLFFSGGADPSGKDIFQFFIKLIKFNLLKTNEDFEFLIENFAKDLKLMKFIETVLYHQDRCGTTLQNLSLFYFSQDFSFYSSEQLHFFFSSCESFFNSQYFDIQDDKSKQKLLTQIWNMYKKNDDTILFSAQMSFIESCSNPQLVLNKIDKMTLNELLRYVNKSIEREDLIEKARSIEQLRRKHYLFNQLPKELLAHTGSFLAEIHSPEEAYEIVNNHLNRPK